MTASTVVETQVPHSTDAGHTLGEAITEKLMGECPDVVVLFASPAYAPHDLLAALHDVCAPAVLVGCSSAGEFTYQGATSSSAVALAIRSDEYRFAAHVGRHLKADLPAAARDLAGSFDLAEDPAYPHRAAMVLMDTLAGYGDEFLEAFTNATRQRYSIFGGGAADDAAFKATYVFIGREAISDAAVALEIKSTRPIGIGVSHGWTPASPALTATAAEGLRLVEIDNRPAIEAFKAFATSQNKSFDGADPLPFFLHHVLGIETAEGYRLRVPLQIDASGALLCAAEIPAGATIRIMRTRDRSAAEAARVAARRAWAGLEGNEPGVAIFFDCAATRLRLGDAFGASVDEILTNLDPATCVGCNTYGQFARREGQFAGFHNCTAVVCALPA